MKTGLIGSVNSMRGIYLVAKSLGRICFDGDKFYTYVNATHSNEDYCSAGVILQNIKRKI